MVNLPYQPSFLLIFSTILILFTSATSQKIAVNQERIETGRRMLGFKETPSGGNLTFECSPSGPCVPCAYSEKNEEKYRCSETGYRIPLKCIEIGAVSKEAKKGKGKKARSTLDATYDEVKRHVMLTKARMLSFSTQQRSLGEDSSKVSGGSHAYITYRSCIPAVNEEKLSVLGFEGIMLGLLLMSGSFMYYRRKRISAASGTGSVRIPNSSRF